MIDLKTQIGCLVNLQTIDSEIYTLKNELASKPKEIEVIDAAFAEKKQHLAGLEANLLNLQKQRKDKELELASKEEGIKKLQGQLYQLKTNKDYQAMLQQIAGEKANSSVIEDGILGIFEQSDKIKNDITREKEKLQEEEKSSQEQKKAIQDRSKEIEERLVQLEAQRKQVLPNVERKMLAQYERILQNRDGLAIVSVKDNSCGGCNMFVPPQVINLIKMYERIITCEVCNRILYIE
ncbi:MAG: C4-type zinc ribbon domain-containing protein [Candidatus Omnitrophica bacterium]|nr:C4-type zinc ribbon domain-containing protein [Candidatus Omnitrophota bacterium]MDD5592558.1 C4-type zinc ribbon domain-containing protein [Candidatus Omnitrophota bacterium]